MTHQERKERRRKIAEAIRAGATCAEAAHQFGVSVSMVQKAAHECGVSARRGLYVQRRREMATAIAEGATCEDTAERFGVSTNTVYKAAHQYATSRARGSQPRMSRSVWDVIDALRAEPTELATNLAKRFGVSHQRIYQIRQQCIAHGLLAPRTTP